MTPGRPMGWAEESEAIVRGLAHSLSNRVAALGLAGESLEDEEAEVRREATAQVQREAEQIAEISRLLKLLPRDGVGRPQALQLSEVLADAVALHGHHLELRGVALATSVSAGALPVRVDRWALLRALVLLISGVRRGAGADRRGEAISIFVEGTEMESWIRTEDGDGQTSEELMALASAMGGRLERAGGEVRLVLPSLVALRQREKQGG